MSPGPKTRCSACRKLQKKGFLAECPGIDKIDKCPRGEVCKLMHENKSLWFLFEKMMAGLWNGQGFNFSAIDFVLNAHEVPETQRQEIRRRCLILVSIWQSIIIKSRKKK